MTCFSSDTVLNPIDLPIILLQLKQVIGCFVGIVLFTCLVLRRRNDAQPHLEIISRLIPTVTYEIIFDPMPEEENSEETGDRSVSGKT